MKRVVFTGIGILMLAFFSVILFMSLERDAEVPVDISTKNADTEVADVNWPANWPKKPKLPEGWSEDPWVKEFDEELAKEAALREKEMEIFLSENIDSMLAKTRSALSDADLAEVDAMFSKFESLERMSESDIIDTLLSFYPEKYRTEGHRQVLIDSFRFLDGFEAKLTKDQKLQFMVYSTQDSISMFKEMDIKVAEASRRAQALKESDPDLYYDTELAKTAAEIPEMEELIREAEESGDTEMAETWRNHLAALHERIDHINSNRDLITSLIKGESLDYLVADHPLVKDLPQVDDNLMERADELVKEVLDFLTQEMDAVSSNESSAASEITPPSSVPEKRSVSAPSVSDFEPLLKNISEKYFDVVLSRHLSEKEFEQYFPSSQYDKEMLKSRTREMQKTLVSELRKVMRNMNSVSEATKRQRVKDFVMKNYDKDFAEAVLRQLNTDDK